MKIAAYLNAFTCVGNQIGSAGTKTKAGDDENILKISLYHTTVISFDPSASKGP